MYAYDALRPANPMHYEHRTIQVWNPWIRGSADPRILQPHSKLLILSCPERITGLVGFEAFVYAHRSACYMIRTQTYRRADPPS